MLLDTLKKKNTNYTPIWFMRQSGRHLQKYKLLRRSESNFINFCLNKNSIIKATLLPLEYYPLDAAILFSDILLVPWVLGQEVSFIENIGPVLTPIESNKKFLSNSFNTAKIQNIGDAIKLIKKQLKNNINLIGFSGAPWTLCCYMIEGGTSKNFEKIRKLLWFDEKLFLQIFDKIIYSVVEFLEYQAKAGCEILMIFDTWCHMIPTDYWSKLAINPIKQIISELRVRNVKCPIIGFPFKGGEKTIQYSYETGVDVVSLDWTVDIKWMCKNLNPEVAVQGNLDPMLLTNYNEKIMIKTVDNILEAMEKKVHIFNLGHGITPEAKMKIVKKLITTVREKSK